MSAPAVHSVHIYDDASALISRLCGIVSSNLRIGHAVLIVATPEHRDELVKELNVCGVDVRGCARDGRFTMLDARELLSTIMLNAMPSRTRFKAAVGKLLADARKAAISEGNELLVFGEMVAVLWDEGKKEAALELERLWNDALNDRAFHLHCAYSRHGFMTGDESAICDLHSHAVIN